MSEQWEYEPRTQVVQHAKEGFYICQIRGWGHLTGSGYAALGLSEEEAMRRQDAIGERIARLPELEARQSELEGIVDRFLKAKHRYDLIMFDKPENRETIELYNKYSEASLSIRPDEYSENLGSAMMEYIDCLEALEGIINGARDTLTRARKIIKGEG